MVTQGAASVAPATHGGRMAKQYVIPAHKVRIYESVGRYFVRCSVCGRLGRSYETRAEAFNRKKADC